MRVWLPLMDTLENKGVSNVNITGSNVTTNASGKIGSCYSFNGSSSYIKLDQSFVTNNTTEFSYACWVKFNSTASACLFSARTATNSNGISLFVNNSGNILYDMGNERRTKAYSFSTGTWYHIAFTYKKGSYKKIYVNGAEIDSVTSTGTMTTVGSVAFIGASQNANTTVNANYLNGYLNDVRIWNDHCLSTAEVKEISQGLVLHYKLDGGTYSQPNLLPCGNTYTYSSPLVRTSKATDGAAWVSNSAFEATPSTTYTISVECDGTLSNAHGRGNLAITDKPWSFWLYICNTDTTKNWSGGAYDTPVNFNSSNNNFRRIGNAYVWTYTLSSTQKYISVRTNTYSDGTNNITVKFWNLKIEKGNVYTPWSNTNSTTITDSSGYGHNGTIVGTLTLTTNTPRYSAATVFNGSSKIYNTTAPIRNTNGTPITVSCWFYQTSRTGYKDLVTARSSNAYIWMLYTHTNDGSIQLHGSAQNKSSIIPSLNVWHHVAAVVNTNNTYDLYLDGVKVVSATSYSYQSQNADTINIGAYGSTTTVNEGWIGYISDVRIYVTALTENDIKQLYNTAAKVDNLHNMHTFEYIEDSSNIKLTKQGQFKEGEIQEDIITKFYKTNNIIKAKNFIES